MRSIFALFSNAKVIPNEVRNLLKTVTIRYGFNTKKLSLVAQRDRAAAPDENLLKIASPKDKLEKSVGLRSITNP